MKPTTEKYREAMAQPIRNQSLAQIQFRNIDPLAAADGTWIDNGHLFWSQIDTLDYDFSYGPTIATLELNRCLLGENFVFMQSPDDPQEDGFVSDHCSTEMEYVPMPYSGGLFAGAANLYGYFGGPKSEPVILVRRFSRPRTFPATTVIFDRRAREWPGRVTVRYYRAGQAAGEQTVEGALETVVFLPAWKVDRVEIQLEQQLPFRRVRIERIIFGLEKIFQNKDIQKITQKHDVDPLSRRIPKEDLSFSVLDFERMYDFDNPSGVWQYIDEHPPVSVRFGQVMADGSIQWTSPDQYIMEGRPSCKDNIASFKATGLSGAMNGTFYKSKLGEKTLYEMAQEVLEDVGFLPSKEGKAPWVIDPSLKKLKTTGVLPVDSHIKCLQIIAHAACCRLYTDSENIFHIVPFRLEEIRQSGFRLGFESILEHSQVASKTPPLQAVEVKIGQLVPEEKTEILFEGEVCGQLHLEFDPMTNVSYQYQSTAQGERQPIFEIYAQAFDAELFGGSGHLTVSGTALKKTTVSRMYPVAPKGEIDTEENPLVTAEEQAERLARHTAAYLTLRNTYDMSYRGNPELETGDVIDLQTPYTEHMDALILTDEITFDGSLQGKIKSKGLKQEPRRDGNG